MNTQNLRTSVKICGQKSIDDLGFPDVFRSSSHTLVVVVAAAIGRAVGLCPATAACGGAAICRVNHAYAIGSIDEWLASVDQKHGDGRGSGPHDRGVRSTTIRRLL